MPSPEALNAARAIVGNLQALQGIRILKEGSWPASVAELAEVIDQSMGTAPEPTVLTTEEGYRRLSRDAGRYYQIYAEKGLSVLSIWVRGDLNALRKEYDRFDAEAWKIACLLADDAKAAGFSEGSPLQVSA